MIKVTFLTGTRADFGKIKSLINVLQGSSLFSVSIFVTGMHNLAKYGNTYLEIEDSFSGQCEIYRYMNQTGSDRMDLMLASTIEGFSKYIKEYRPDYVVVHGDRIEALAGAVVGSLNNIATVHVEGGEVSGTVDEIIRHSVSKLSHLHCVANIEAQRRLRQLGEDQDRISIIGSPDIDVMFSDNLPTLEEVYSRYDIQFETYSILMFHPVTTEVDVVADHAESLARAVKDDGENYIVIHPNNDHGNDHILAAYDKYLTGNHFRRFPSVRFEFFLTLLKNAKMIVGNSSAGIREAPIYKIPCVDIGSRQSGRSSNQSIISCSPIYDDIKLALKKAKSINMDNHQTNEFGSGNGDSAEKFLNFMELASKKPKTIQKVFRDIVF